MTPVGRDIAIDSVRFASLTLLGGLPCTVIADASIVRGSRAAAGNVRASAPPRSLPHWSSVWRETTRATGRAPAWTLERLADAQSDPSAPGGAATAAAPVARAAPQTTAPTALSTDSG